MKKFAVVTIGILLISFGIQAQTSKTLETVVDSTALVADTTIMGPYSYDYNWTLFIETWSLDAADAQLKIQTAPDSTNIAGWEDYALSSTFLLDKTTGLKAFEDYFLNALYMRIITIPNSVSSGEFRIRLQKIKK